MEQLTKPLVSDTMLRLMIDEHLFRNGNLMGAQHGMQKVRDIYEAELQRLRAQVEAMRVAGSAMEGLVMSAQSFLAKHLPPDGTSEKETISELLGLLDGPHQRNVQKAWTASLNPTPTNQDPT